MVATNSYLITTIVTLTIGLLKFGDALCPESNAKTGMKRIGNTRYFIHHLSNHKKDKTMFLDWAAAKAKCSQSGFKMATIEDERTFAVVGRALEQMVVKEKLRDTWYWLDARYNGKEQGYFWSGDTKRPVKFSNYFYRYPRPTGIGSHFSSPFKKDDKYEINNNETQCLTLALPLPSNVVNRGQHDITFGHSTTFDERPCIGVKKRHAMCESTLPECNVPNTDPFILTEDKTDYFEKGNWILGNRRYIVNWKQRSINESRKYCKDIGLELYDPIVGKETVMIPHLKMWSRNITVSQFWTGWSYTITTPGVGEEGKFVSPDGVVRQESRFWANFSEPELGRSDKFDTTLCVAMQHSYEFRRTQFPCPSDSDGSGCHWSYVQFVPANCNNYHATMCQHSDSGKARIEWDGPWAKMPLKFVNDGKMATATLGYSKNKDARRSKFKQTFGNLQCTKGYRMARANTAMELMAKPTDMMIMFKYDYSETYWVVDEEGFNKTTDSKCTISSPSGTDVHTRKNEKVPCTEFHFYLCEKIKVRLRPFEGELTQVPNLESSKWNEERNERLYPIIKPK